MKEEQDKYLDQIKNDFEDTDENKLVYTQHHTKFIDLFEGKIMSQMKAKYPDFSEVTFIEELNDRLSRNINIDKTVLDTLNSFVEFSHFKEIVLQFKRGNFNPVNSKISLSKWNEE